MRRFATTAALCFVLPLAAARAGDYADREILGFSPDGSAFAFEEYGIEDGSGFPYSNIYVVDVEADRWVAGTPIRLRDEDESRPLDEIRAEARDRALEFLEQENIAGAGTLVASNPATETSADPHHVTFLPRLIVPPSGTGMSLELAEIDLPAPHCPDMGETYKGFELVLRGASDLDVLQSDSQIPQSRRCPVGYSLSDVITHYPEGGEPVIAILVNVHSLGFEGPDRRFLAVTRTFKE